MSDTPDVTREIPAPHQVSAPADATTQIDVVRRVVGPVQVALAFVAVAAAAFLLGIMVATATKPSPRADVLAEAEVGPEGRTVRFTGGQATFPAGAVTRPIQVVVSSFPVDEQLRVQHSDGPIVIEPGKLTAYSFEPSDVSFSKPVELTFRLPAGSRNGSVFARRGDEINILTGTIDPARSTATTRVRDFRFGAS